MPHPRRGNSVLSLVELRGLEPLTPCMPCRCATSCATAPNLFPGPYRPKQLVQFRQFFWSRKIGESPRISAFQRCGGHGRKTDVVLSQLPSWRDIRQRRIQFLEHGPVTVRYSCQ